MIRQTEAIVLKSFDYRETSRIVTFFTKDHGKVKGILKGIRKDPKKFGSSVDKFSVNDIVYYHHRNSDLHLVGQCDLSDYFFPIRQDLKKTLAVSYVLELVDAIMPVEEPNGDVYRLMMDFLTGLQSAADTGKMVHLFQIKILLLSGFRPHLDSCMQCHKRVAGKARFSSMMGGLVCMDCRVNDNELLPISSGTVASILHVEKSNWPEAMRLGLSTPIKKELQLILNNFLVFHLERHLKSSKYL